MKETTENQLTPGQGLPAPVRSACAECGMIVDPGEYHPFAACLMFKASQSSAIVRGNLWAVRESATDEMMGKISSVIKSFRAEADSLRLEKSPRAMGGLIVYEDMANVLDTRRKTPIEPRRTHRP